MAFGPNVEESKDARNNAAPAQNNNAGGNGNGAVERLRMALESGGHIAATNKIGVSSGVTGLGGRELTAAEARFAQNRQSSTADYAARKAATALRKGNLREATSLASLEKFSRANAADIQNQRAKSALNNISRPIQVGFGSRYDRNGRYVGSAWSHPDGGAEGRNDPNALLAQLDQSLSGDKPILPPGPLSDQAREIMSSVRSALAQAKAGGAGSSMEQSGDLFSQFMDALSPKPTQPTMPMPTAATDMPNELPSLRMVALSGGGGQIPAYDYNGMTVFLGDDIDTNDATAVRGRIDETNDLIDMMNEAYA